MYDKVFPVIGNKISSFIIGDNALQFSSKKFATVDEFREAWAKKISLATKVEVKYDKISSIKKEENESKVLIKYKTWAGIPAECEFSFIDQDDYEVLFNFLERERYFSRIYETLSPFRSIINYLVGLAITISITIFAYYQAVKIANGTEGETARGKARLFNFIVGKLGDKGVIAVGTLISCYLLFKAWKRFSNPPNQVRFLPRAS